MQRKNKLLATAGLGLVLALSGCVCSSKSENKPQASTPVVRVPYSILGQDTRIKCDIVRESTPSAFKVYKVDLGDKIGSYGLISNQLHWYQGEGEWKPIQGAERDNWKSQLETEIRQKISDGSVEGEGVQYNPGK